jgi:hypothetical protein
MDVRSSGIGLGPEGRRPTKSLEAFGYGKTAEITGTGPQPLSVIGASDLRVANTVNADQSEISVASLEHWHSHAFGKAGAWLFHLHFF